VSCIKLYKPPLTGWGRCCTQSFDRAHEATNRPESCLFCLFMLQCIFIFDLIHFSYLFGTSARLSGSIHGTLYASQSKHPHLPQWTRNLFSPLQGQSWKSCLDNYRPIALASILSKVIGEKNP